MNKTNRIRVIHKFGNHQGMVVYDKDYIAPTLTQGFGVGGQTDGDCRIQTKRKG